MLALCPTVILLHSDCGLAAEFLARIETLVRARGLAAVLCRDPLDPRAPEGVLLPGAGRAFYRHSPGVKPPRGTKHIYLDRGAPGDGSAAQELRKNASLRSTLLRRAVEALAEAKRRHDALEELYRPAVDFAAVERFTRRHIADNI